MSLTVNVKNAKNLPNVEKFSLSDPLAVLLFGNSECQRSIVIISCSDKHTLPRRNLVRLLAALANYRSFFFQTKEEDEGDRQQP